MQSFLIVSKDNQKIDTQLENLFKKFSIGKFDITEYSGDFGIEQVRNLKKNIFLSPLKGEYKAVVIRIMDTITIEAQNAFLKILEEPPKHTIMILTSPSKDIFLPTVLSRCFITEEKEDKKEYSQAEKKEYKDYLEQIVSDQIGPKLKLAQDFGKSREEALLFIEGLILTTREKMLGETQNHEEVKKCIFLIKNCQKTYKLIKSTNVSPRFALENLFLEI